ncbi:LamB/YcsF family protein [Aquisalibacillus elongatus]|uniref:5-oxoprolinase subunit A n=1 Tax=Aquisalibacillus elongatus TaxID=485577 RepID=A0A3N5C6T4_9BACI|nr:5-oxoprolinase subunit PxpA [Aquisalibacillus elongatus]RPF52141.1 UPF0271 protein [Aquisalibacillus elongatus]
MKTIDLNADLGESFGIYSFGHDHELLDVVSSANVACGFHAGDYQTIPKTIQLAKDKGVAIGAHPGFPDLKGFGRKQLDLNLDEIYDLVVYQLGAFQGFAQLYGLEVQHVKPHGALYNMANRNYEMAQTIAQAVCDFNPKLKLFGLCNSFLVEAGREKGLDIVQEAFADRTYTEEGLLMPRHEPGSVKHQLEDIVEQVINIVKNERVLTNNGTYVKLNADTICLHGDTPEAAQNARLIKQALEDEQIQIKSLE